MDDNNNPSIELHLAGHEATLLVKLIREQLEKVGDGGSDPNLSWETKVLTDIRSRIGKTLAAVL